MTDRIKGFVVVLKEDLREDDAEATLKAIEMVKGVIKVTPVMSDAHDYIIRQQVKQEFREKIYALALD